MQMRRKHAVSQENGRDENAETKKDLENSPFTRDELFRAKIQLDKQSNEKNGNLSHTPKQKQNFLKILLWNPALIRWGGHLLFLIDKQKMIQLSSINSYFYPQILIRREIVQHKKGRSLAFFQYQKPVFHQDLRLPC